MSRGALQKLTEFAPLVALAMRQRPHCVLEIGTARGGSLWAWCQVADANATVVSVDLPGGPFGVAEGNLGVEGHDYARSGQSITLLKADSHAEDTHKVVTSLVGRSLDFLFLDGDHTYEGISQDFHMYGSLVRPGGMIAFHDVMPEPDLPPEQVGDVHVFWPQIKQHYHYVEFLDPVDDRNWGGRWGGIGVVWTV